MWKEGCLWKAHLDMLLTPPSPLSPALHSKTEVSDEIKYGMIEAISHLIHRDYEAIVKDFVTLEFIPEGTDLRPILPVLAKVLFKSRQIWTLSTKS